MSADVLQVDRLAAVLGMLGSDHDGEVLAAARHAERLRRQANVAWADILRGPVPASPQPPPPPPHDVLHGWPAFWKQAAELVARDGGGVVRPQDVEFAETVAGYAHRPSLKQLAYLFDLVCKTLAVRP